MSDSKLKIAYFIFQINTNDTLSLFRMIIDKVFLLILSQESLMKIHKILKTLLSKRQKIPSLSNHQICQDRVFLDYLLIQNLNSNYLSHSLLTEV